MDRHHHAGHEDARSDDEEQVPPAEAAQTAADGHPAHHGHPADEPLPDEAMDTATHGRDGDHHHPQDAAVEEAARHDHAAMDHSTMDRAAMGHAATSHGGGHAAHVDHAGHEEMFRREFWVSLLLSIPVLVYSPMLQMWLGFTAPDIPCAGWIAPVFGAMVFFYGGLPFLQMAVPEIRNRQPGMMTLISLAIVVAFVYSLAALLLPESETFFWELATLIDIMLLGHWIEMRSVRQASRALDELSRLMPDTAERLSGGSAEVVPVSALRSGDLLLVRPGASVPADGEVVEGESDVDEALVTGESRPVEKRPGDSVIAGTINGDGSLRVRVTATGDETALAGIMRLVAEAQQSKSGTQLLADRAAGWLFYIALAVAAITAVAWTLTTGFGVDVVARVATVLVIACPHALGLAIPLVVAITTALGARNGVLVRERSALEKARLVDTVIFDKTGTLTRGERGVVAIRTTAGWTEDEAVRRLHAMGVEVAMLTGDAEAVAATVAADLGIDTYFAGVLPQHKEERVAALQRQGKQVAMVGDGVNDAPALARADVGIAIGSGTDVAVASAGIILVQSNPLDVVNVLQLSRAGYRKMIENLLWAAGYNVVALPLAAGVLAPWGIVLSPAVGALLMSVSTIVVAINAQLLRRQIDFAG